MGNRIVMVLITVTVCTLSPTQSAEAGYIDPNTGGLLFQLLATMFAIVSGLILVFSSRIKMGFARLGRYLRELLGKTK